MPSKQVLLVNTNRMRPAIAPLALDYIGAALRSVGHRVSLLDLCLAENPVCAMDRAVTDFSPDLVAVTFRNTDDCYFASRTSFADVLRSDIQQLRERFDGPVIVGGCGFSTMPIRLLEYAGAAFGVRGDGELALVQFLQAMDGRAALRDVPGLVFRENTGWRENGRAVTDLSLFDLSARDLLDNQEYFRVGGQAGIETKRGCTKRCVYCVEPVLKGHRSRCREPAEVVREIRNLLRQGIDCFHTCDSEFNLPLAHATAVCQALIDARLGDRIRWYAYAMPVPFTNELAALMKRAGCVGIDFGVDSGSDSMLRALNRDYDASCLQTTADICKRHGIAFMYDLLLGAPGETLATLAETVERVKHVSPDCVGVSLGVRVYPGTPLAHQLASGDAGIVGDPGGLQPYFFMSPHLGADPESLVRELIAGDPRFFLPGG